MNMTFVTPFQVRTCFLFENVATDASLLFKATDLTRLSEPFAYYSIVVDPEDGNSHEVEVYADVGGGTYLYTHSAVR